MALPAALSSVESLLLRLMPKQSERVRESNTPLIVYPFNHHLSRNTT